MNRRGFAWLLIAALTVLLGAYFVNAHRNRLRESDVALLPSFANDLNTITTVLLRKGTAAPTLTLHLVNNHWSVAQRADYPADVSKIRNLLLSLRDAKIIEEKTSDPARFAGIGVEDPGAAGATGVEITVTGPNAKLSLVVGKSVGQGSFVRRTGEMRTFSVEPAISVEITPKDWIDSRLIDVPLKLIQRIEVKPAAGASYVIHRLNSADDTFSLDAVPAGRKPRDGHALAPSPTILTGLDAEDVSPAGAIDFATSSQAIVTLTDGSLMTLTGAAIADKHWIEVTSTKDAALTAKAAGRAFEIASYKYDALFRPAEQLLEPKEPAAHKASKSPPGPATPHTAKSPLPAAPQ